MKIKLTKTKVEALPFPDSGQAFYTDTELKGFGLRIGKTTKAYYAEKRINGKTVRHTIGIHGQKTTEQARKLAQEFLGVMTGGVNPTDEKKQERSKGITLKEAFDDFLKARKALKPRTVKDYQYFMNRHFADWLNKSLIKITKDMVERRHTAIGESKSGEAQANLAMRYLRAIFNFAIDRYEDSKGQSFITDNPVKRLSRTKAWYRVERKKSVIKAHELPALFNALDNLKETNTTSKAEIVRDYILLLLFTGLRRQEGATLKWENIDFTAKTLTVLDTKNNEPLTLPLSDFLYDLLEERRIISESDYVFPGEGAGGYLVEPKRQLNKVRKESGLTFSLHDLRRTFITIAESLDIPYYAIKMLVNHSLGSDVTAGYIVSDVERLRAPMQKITNKILKEAGRREQAKIINIR